LVMSFDSSERARTLTSFPLSEADGEATAALKTNGGGDAVADDEKATAGAGEKGDEAPDEGANGEEGRDDVAEGEGAGDCLLFLAATIFLVVAAPPRAGLVAACPAHRQITTARVRKHEVCSYSCHWENLPGCCCCAEPPKTKDAPCPALGDA
jgi:hypothetical protein